MPPRAMVWTARLFAHGAGVVTWGLTRFRPGYAPDLNSHVGTLRLSMVIDTPVNQANREVTLVVQPWELDRLAELVALAIAERDKVSAALDAMIAEMEAN